MLVIIFLTQIQKYWDIKTELVGKKSFNFETIGHHGDRVERTLNLQTHFPFSKNEETELVLTAIRVIKWLALSHGII